MQKLNIDYAFKAKVIESGLASEVNQIEKAMHASALLHSTGQIVKCNLDFETAYNRWSFLTENAPDAYLEARRINKARYKRVGRLYERIYTMLAEYPESVFLTLTFTDIVLKSTSAETRRKYVQRYLRAYGVPYVANKDFGAKNEREHYHAVIACHVDLDGWIYGFALAKPITINRTVPKRYKNLPDDEIAVLMFRDNCKALAKYTAKLTNHAIKETCKRSAVMYYAPNKGKKAE